MNHDSALKEESNNLWTVKCIGRMVGQTPMVFTIQTPDASGKNGGYSRMILARCLKSLKEHFALGFSWKIFDNNNCEINIKI